MYSNKDLFASLNKKMELGNLAFMWVSELLLCGLSTEEGTCKRSKGTGAENSGDQVRKSKEHAEKELKYMEKQRNQLQPIINSIDKELKNSGQIKLVLPEVEALELASAYRNKKIKPLFAKMENYIAGVAAKVIELSREAEKWRDKYQQLKKDYDDLEKDADKVADLCNQLCDDVDKLEVISDKYNRALRIFGSDIIESAIWHDIQREKH